VYKSLSGTPSEEARNADALCGMEGTLIILQSFTQEVAQEFTHFFAVGLSVFGVDFEGEGGGEQVVVEGFIEFADAHTGGDGPIGILGLYGLHEEFLRSEQELGFFFNFLSHDMDGAAVTEGGLGEIQEGDFCEEEFCFSPGILLQLILWGGGGGGDGFEEELGFGAFSLFQQANGVFGFSAQLPAVVGAIVFSNGFEQGGGLFQLAAFKVAEGQGEAGLQGQFGAKGVSDGFKDELHLFPVLQLCPEVSGLKAVGHI